MGRNQPEADGFDIAERLQEMEPTLARRGLHSLIGVFGLSLVTSPWMGWAGSMVAGAVLVYWIISMGPLRRLIPIRDRMLLNLLVVNLGLAVSLATSGGPRSPVLPIVAAVPVAVVIMFPRQPLLVYGAPVVATLAGTLVIHPQETIEDPAPTLITLAAAILVPFLVLEGIDLELAHRKRALVDSLTGCLNRHALDHRVAELEAQCRLTGARIGVVAFDVDHFKRITTRPATPWATRCCRSSAMPAARSWATSSCCTGSVARSSWWCCRTAVPRSASRWPNGSGVGSRPSIPVATGSPSRVARRPAPGPISRWPS